ncbi:hypothetical protein Pla163_25920 [Planctomycetes bacterium Pla163]|uniref:SH3b domain-containing protein n=1 Tax=Rohdeia mirabilis TaxID=2528008 RepID=A0A518D1V6_9BACT|nr:hypothetical protein Pla163_25920 [Planctomycetes bacterium Pla163]
MEQRSIARLRPFVAAALVLFAWTARPAAADPARGPFTSLVTVQGSGAQARESSVVEAAAPTPESGGAKDEEAGRFFSEPSDAQRRAAELFDAGVGAWRESRYGRAEELWLVALDTIGAPPETDSADAVLFDRHALLFNLGNAAFRAERPLEAVGWYRAALRHQPRHAATHDNLELARQRAELDGGTGLEPTAAWGAYLAAWTPGEARWLALLGLGPLAVTLLIEALRGGRAAMLWAGSALVVAGVLFAPLVHGHLTADERPQMVIAPEGVSLRSEARTGSTVVARAAAGEDVLRRDALPEWIQVELADGTLGWVPRAELFDLRR